MKTSAEEKPTKGKKTLNSKQRVALTVWMSQPKIKEEHEFTQISALCELAEKELGFHVPYYSVMTLRKDLGWRTSHGGPRGGDTTQKTRIIRLHLNDFEQRLKALEDKYALLESLLE